MGYVSKKKKGESKYLEYDLLYIVAASVLKHSN